MSTKLTSCLVALALAAALSPLAVAQVINAEQIVLQGRVPPTVSGIVAQPTGTQGSATLYYWVTARYPSGVSTPAGPARAVNTQGIDGLSPANAVRISWQAAAGVGPTVCSTGGASTGALAICLNGAWTCLGI
jgi:hypothetical protein